MTEVDVRFVQAVALLAILAFLGGCIGLLFVAEAACSAMRHVRTVKQREAKRRYLEKLKQQSRERHRIKKRIATRPCPTPEEVGAQWDKSHDSLREMINFGLLLLDVEPYVDNSLIFATDDAGRRIIAGGKAIIIGRNPGLKGWLAEHCPHIGYVTAIRYKSLAEKSQKIKNPAKTIGKSTSAFHLREAIYKELGILHYKLDRPRRPRCKYGRASSLPRPGQGEHRHQSFIYRLRAQTRDALESLPDKPAQRFVNALANLANEVQSTS